MVQIIFRAFSTVVTAMIAVLVFATVGETPSGKLWTAVITASVIALVEWLIIWTPKHFAVARKLLDPRASMIGMWLQIVDEVLPRKEGGRAAHGPEDIRFSIFWVDYSNPDGGYGVHGFAYDREGNEQARWHSVGIPEFAPDGSSMTYRWEGDIMGNTESADDPARTGIATINVREGKTGKIEHVGMGLNLVVSYKQVAQDLLNQIGFGQYRPDSLKDMDIRNKVASAYAETLARQAT